jgi:hypothetical protein
LSSERAYSNLVVRLEFPFDKGKGDPVIYGFVQAGTRNWLEELSQLTPNVIRSFALIAFNPAYRK